jgi:hypothetical protein
MKSLEGGDSMAAVYLRDFPDDLHRKAKSEAALEGLSLKVLYIEVVKEYLQKRKGGKLWHVLQKDVTGTSLTLMRPMVQL